MSTVETMLLGLRSLAARAVALFKLMTEPERVLAATLSGVWAITLVAAIIGGDVRDWSIVVGAVLLLWLNARVIADSIVSRQVVMQAYAETPTGAPRVAEVTCRHGDHHRFLYGPDGWEPAGPAVAHRPEGAATP